MVSPSRVLTKLLTFLKLINIVYHSNPLLLPLISIYLLVFIDLLVFIINATTIDIIKSMLLLYKLSEKHLSEK